MAGSIPGPERRIVLVGESGCGISAMGNTILGREVFRSGWSVPSGTEVCQKGEEQLKGRKVVVVDTPGFASSHRSEKDIAAEVSKCLKLCSPGPHVILHLIRPSHSFHPEMKVVQEIEEVFGLKAKDYTIILLTHEDLMEAHCYMSSRDEDLKKYFAECGNRILAFDLWATVDERVAQMDELMTMIDDLVCKNKYAPCYTEDMMNDNKIPNF